MTGDGLDPPGEQLELFPMPDVIERIVHRAEVHRNGVLYRWSCACGATGIWTTYTGRANAGRRAHLRAAYRRIDDRP
jgi:hypothetical protein